MYQATITRNFRDAYTTTPKVLLLNVIDENGRLFRDHCWVVISDALERFIPQDNHVKNVITFHGRVKEYHSFDSMSTIKKTFSSLKKIDLLRQIKSMSK
ncbi:hypothetical protein KKG72_07570 [bacterium]|nr:hypothetical protein [bacterium]MBU1994106.1 hypothetical protein [bacterium]